MLIYRFAISPGNPGYQSQSSGGPMCRGSCCPSRSWAVHLDFGGLEIRNVRLLSSWRDASIGSGIASNHDHFFFADANVPDSFRAASDVQVKLVSVVFDHNLLWENQDIAKIHKDTLFSTLHTLVGRINVFIRLAKQAHEARRGFGVPKWRGFL